MTAIDLQRRFGLLSATAVPFLLSIQVYARLTGYDLGYSAVLPSKAAQAILFFAYLGLNLLLAARALAGAAADGRNSIVSCVVYAMISGLAVASLILGTCYLTDGDLRDVAGHVRFEVARLSRVLTPVLSILSYILVRPWMARNPSDETAGWAKVATAFTAGLIVCALGLYFWDNLKPWPEPMVEQLLVVLCGFVGPAFVLTVLAMSLTSRLRIVAACGAAALTVIAAAL